MTRRKLSVTMKRRRDSDAGSALMEFALSLPVLLLILTGAVEFGRFAYLAIEMTNAAKAAAQYGAQNPTTAADQTGMNAVAQQDAPDALAACTKFQTSFTPQTGDPPSFACVSSIDNSSTMATSGSSCGTNQYMVQNLEITTTAQCSPFIYPNVGTLTLTGHAVQEVLQ